MPEKKQSLSADIAQSKHYDPYLDTKQAAEYCSFNVETIREGVRRRELAAMKTGAGPKARYRIRLSELNRWMKSQEVKASRVSGL